MSVVTVISVIAAISQSHNRNAINIAFALKRKTYSNVKANIISQHNIELHSRQLVAPRDRLVMAIPLPVGTSYKFRVVAVNVIGSSPPSAPSKAYTVVGGRTHERPVDGPYITYNEAINETTIILKWTVSGWKKNLCFCLLQLDIAIVTWFISLSTVHACKQHAHLWFLHLLPANRQR